jgi:SAM-dependent methyltransferase
VFCSQEYRAYVGNEAYYDLASALQFNLLTVLGLREHHYLLDIGCGSLRAGRLFIPYLRPGRYFGVEPIEWLVQKGLDEELGQSAIEIKRPTFLCNEQFEFGRFGRSFDFLLAQSIFSHTSQAQLRRCLSQAARVMTPTSIFAATFFEDETDYTGDWNATHAGYTMATMRSFIEEQGLIMRPIEWDHQDLQRWILILHKDTLVPPLDIGNPARSVYIENQLDRARAELRELRHHPYVRAGLLVKRSLTRLHFGARRLRRALLDS